MKKSLPVYLVMVSYGRENLACSVISDYLKCEKPNINTFFIVVENSKIPKIQQLFDFEKYNDIKYHRFCNKNKASAINFVIRELIKEREALIICIDNDISFPENFLVNYYNTALQTGNRFFYGSSFYVNLPVTYDRNLDPYLSNSAVGISDEHFKKMKKLMFLGFSYCFYKSQWKKVDGLDERFSPGSEINLGAEESIFQKKMVYAGYTPYLVENNSVEHKTQVVHYTFDNVIKRQKNNGFTHGFQDIILSNKKFKNECFRRLLGLIKRCFILFLKGDRIKFKMKLAYTKGFFNSFILYCKIDNKNSYLKF